MKNVSARLSYYFAKIVFQNSAKSAMLKVNVLMRRRRLDDRPNESRPESGDRNGSDFA